MDDDARRRARRARARSPHRWQKTGAGLAALICGAALATAAPAETLWSKGAPLTVRSQPGTEYRILAYLQPGDRVEVLESGDEWTRVRLGDGKEGWTPSGYLDATPPPVQSLERLREEVSRLEGERDHLSTEAETLRSQQETLSSADASQRERIDELSRENLRLRAGERWLEWATGGSLLLMGMVLGAILRSLGQRRKTPRLRL